MIKLPNVDGKLEYNVSLAKYSWFGVGGNAEALFKPKDVNDLVNFLRNIDKSTPITVIGGGSNLLIRDGGIDGVVIVLKDTLKNIELKDDYIEVDCGIQAFKLYEFAKNNEIDGYTFLGTLPGTIGGAIRGNAGCYGGEIGNVLLSVEAVDFSGNVKTFTAKECNFEYRKNNLPNDLIFTRAKFKITGHKPKEEIENQQKENLEKRNNSQPMGEKTCGSTFKNMPERPAWKVVQELGYQGKEINGAKMSEKHANFMINTGKAKAADLEKLVELIKNEAKLKMGIDLEPEIKIIGNK